VFKLAPAIVLTLILIGSAVSARSQSALPNPVLAFSGSTTYQSEGKNYTRYHFYIANADRYAELFAPAPELPPCGQNTNASRTWVDLYDSNDKRLYGFCAIMQVKELADIWFNLPEGTTPPSWVYVELTDRKSSTKYKSNIAETVL